MLSKQNIDPKDKPQHIFIENNVKHLVVTAKVYTILSDFRKDNVS